MNPLYQQMRNPTNNIVSQFQSFKNNFRGNPQQMVQQMLNSGRISQEQYNSAVQKANQLAQMMGIK